MYSFMTNWTFIPRFVSLNEKLKPQCNVTSREKKNYNVVLRSFREFDQKTHISIIK